MRRCSIAATIVLLIHFTWSGSTATAQSMDDLNLQAHGYATQGFIYSTSNNWNTTNSTDGSAAWMEAVVNVTAQPQPKLSIGVQARYFLLGTYGNQIKLDFAQGDYKVNEYFGFRVGKVKTPAGLLNETQDIDPAQLWILLPQSIYSVAGRDSNLAHLGGVVYGTLALGKSLGKVEYRAFGGERVIDTDDGALVQFTDQGFQMPNGLSGRVFGGRLDWKTPLSGLMIGASEESDNPSGNVTRGTFQGTIAGNPISTPHVFAQYERGKLMVAGEYRRGTPNDVIRLTGLPPVYVTIDQRSFYAMASYKISEKLSGGLYYSSSLDRKAAYTSARYQKDWALTGRYDFNPFLYAKFEEHFVDGTETGYSITDNSGGLKPNSRMTLLKIGVSF